MKAVIIVCSFLLCYFEVGSGEDPKTRIHLYYHNNISSDSDSDMLTIGNPSNNGTSSAGKIKVIDAPIYDGPEPNAMKMGRVVGMFASASRSTLGLVAILNYEFTDGLYNGSALTAVGLGYPNTEVREEPIVGGSGVFRMACGYGLSRTIMYPVNTNTRVSD